MAGQPADRLPVWVSRHSQSGFKQTAREMLEQEISFQQQFDWDMARISPAAALYMEDYGCRFAGNNHLGVPACTKYAVEHLRDWEKIRPLDPETGSLGEIARANRLLIRETGDRKPVLITAFSPLTIAEKLAGKALLQKTADEEPELLQPVLAAIVKTMSDFIRFSNDGGNNSLYFATQTANHEWLTDDQFRQLGQAHDLALLTSVRHELHFTILHLHGDQLRVSPFADYPVDIVHWADRRSTPELSLAAAKTLTDKCLMGGINGRTTLCTGSRQDIEREARDAVRQAGEHRLILSPCCVIPVVGVPEQNLHALKQISVRL